MVYLAPPPGKVATSTGVVLRVRRFTHVHLDLDDRFVVAAVGLKGPGSARAVLVAYSLGAADHAIGLIERSLGIALPLLALLVGVLVGHRLGAASRRSHTRGGGRTICDRPAAAGAGAPRAG